MSVSEKPQTVAGQIGLWLSEYSLNINEENNAIARVLRKRNTEVVTDFRDVTRGALPFAYSKQVFRYFGFYSGLVSPVIQRGRVYGAMLLINREKREVVRDIPFVESFTALISTLLSGKEDIPDRGVSVTPLHMIGLICPDLYHDFGLGYLSILLGGRRKRGNGAVKRKICGGCVSHKNRYFI